MLAACARCVASIVIGSRHSKRGCAGKKPLSFGARLWCDVPVTPPNAKTRSAVAPPLADSGEEAQQANLLCARASPRWLRSGRVPRMGAVPAKGLPPLARYRGATCQLRPPRPNKRRVSRGAVALALVVFGEEAHAKTCFARALRRAGCGLIAFHEKALDWREACLLRPALLVRRASCDLQRQTSAACHAAQSSRRSLSLGRRRSTQACCVCALCRFSCAARAIRKGAAPARSHSPSARARGATCQLRPPTQKHAAQWRRRSLTRARRHSRQTCFARALRRAGCGLIAFHEKALDWRKACLLRPALLVRRTSCDLQRKISAACHAAQSSRRSLSLGRRHSTQACCVCAPCRFGYDRLAPFEKGLRWQEATLLRRALVVRRARYGPQRQNTQRSGAAAR